MLPPNFWQAALPAQVVSIVRYRAFAAMQTGNTIWLGRVIGDDLPDDWNAPFYYAAIPMCFVAGAVLHQLLEKTHFPNRGASIAAVPLASLMMVGEAVPCFEPCELGMSTLILTILNGNSNRGY